ncbi:chitobiase/beta-hexosaminidase C-terminal domain-containing protein [Acidicapsa acidisoli]|uniref:chitobiase/beta-hexosaminidase C-terminal domain-containing protein n=1 Tax=Acidicapsa acidisoli TaxID=1615681 RepID=UPI0021E09F0C|nr:chitobiase/beta-hexosaminidase C-terminal domain-containing protein [Acidicapsa acidisoli]
MPKLSLPLLFVAVVVVLSGCSSSNHPSSPMPPTLPSASAPTFLPMAGSYNSAQSVQIMDATSGAKIYYTTDGSTPTASSTQYTASIQVSATETLKAIAVATNYDPSAETDAAYTINHPVMYTIAGTTQSGDCGSPAVGPMLATASELGVPGGIAVDPAGDVYIADSGDNCVREISKASGVLTAIVNTANGLTFPMGMSLDNSGNLYIADYFNNLIREVSVSNGSLTVVAGGGSGDDGGPATGARLSSPEDVGVDAAGNLYIADSGDNLVRKVTAATGIITTVAGTGTSGYSGDGGAATNAELNYPAGVALDSAGDIFIADYNNNVVREVSAKTGLISTVAGNGFGAGSGKKGSGTGGYAGDGGAATSAELFNPEGVAVDSAGNLYIADHGNGAIREVSTAGIITTIAGNGTNGYNGSGGSDGKNELSGPEKITFDKTGNLYIADAGNNLVREVIFYPSLPGNATPTPVITQPSGTFSTVEGTGITDSNAAAQIYYTTDGSIPTSTSTVYSGGILIDSSATLQAIALAPGYSQSQIASAVYTSTVPPNATPTFSPPGGTYASPQTVTICCADNRFTVLFYTIDGSPPSSSTTSARYDDAIIVGANETLSAQVGSANAPPSAVATASYIITTPASQLIYTVAGNRAEGYSGDGGNPLAATFNNPGSVALDGAGNLYVADSGNNVIREISASTGLITTIAGSGHSGYTGDGGPAIDATLSTPLDIAIDSAGDIYIADSGNNVIRRISASNGMISTVAGTGHAGFSGDGAAATLAELNSPTGIALDKVGNLFIADSSNLRVREVSATTGVIKTVAGGGSGGDGGLATAASLTAASRVAFDSTGNLYIACAFTIEQVSAKTGVINAVAGFNPPENAMYFFPVLGDGGPATSGFLATPVGMLFDSMDNLYIANAGNNRIREVFATTGIITTIAGSDLVGASGDGGPATNAALNGPTGIVMDKHGSLYIADVGNMVVREVVGYAKPSTALTATPEITPAGGTFATPPIVTISDSTPGSAIYFTLDGTAPGTSSPMYSGPVQVPSTASLRAIAIAPGYLWSSEASAAFTVTSAPSASSPITGTVSNGYKGADSIGQAQQKRE